VKGAVGCAGRIVIVGGGAAGFAAAEMLRRQDYRGSIVMAEHEAASAGRRPNLSKDYLAGSAPEDWLPLRPDDFYAEAKIDLRPKAEVTSIDVNAPPCRHIRRHDHPYDRLLLATARTGTPADTRRGPAACAVLRSLADPRDHCIGRWRAGGRSCSRELDRARAARRCAPEIEVHVVGLEQRPMERVLGRRWATSSVRA